MTEIFDQEQEKRIGLYFHVSVYLKGLISLAEVIGGIVVLFVPVSAIANVVIRLAQGELTEEPNDFIATHLVNLAHQFSVASGIFIAVYLLSRGLIKLGLVIALLKNQLWAYPNSLAVLALFMLYQIYQISVSFSALLVGLTIFDVVVMWSIWREYQVMKSEALRRE